MGVNINTHLQNITQIILNRWCSYQQEIAGATCLACRIERH